MHISLLLFTLATFVNSQSVQYELDMIGDMNPIRYELVEIDTSYGWCHGCREFFNTQKRNFKRQYYADNIDNYLKLHNYTYINDMNPYQTNAYNNAITKLYNFYVIENDPVQICKKLKYCKPDFVNDIH